MSKQHFGMDINDEASKLLEKALSSFDGIILGKLKCRLERKWLYWFSSFYVHSRTIEINEVWPLLNDKILFLDDQNAQPSALNVLSAATTLALALQQCKSSPSPPDKETAEIISAWLEDFLPVSFSFFFWYKYLPIIHSPFAKFYERDFKRLSDFKLQIRYAFKRWLSLNHIKVIPKPPTYDLNDFFLQIAFLVHCMS